MADIDLPVWSVPPNWINGVTERLEWLSNVHRSKVGSEQRTGVRETPRRFFEFRINPIGGVRSYVDLWLHNQGESECLLPVWHDKAKLSANAADAATRIEFDTTFREYQVGGMAIIFKGAFTFEVVEIDAIDDDGLDLAAPLADPWPHGATVYPIVKCYLDPEVSSDALTSRVGETQMAFQVNQDNHYDPGDETLTIYAGYPLIQVEPNRMDALTTQYARIMETLDEQIGLIARYDSAGRAFPTQFYNWQAKGRQQHHELRQLFYRLHGQQKAVWMPTFNDDIILARDLTAISNRLSVLQIGYALTGGAQPGRNRVMIRGDDGANHVLQISGTTAALGAGEERLTLPGVSGFTAPTGRPGSFLDTYRLDQDVIEIMHHTDSEGVCEVSAAFRAFADTRVITGPLLDPTPVDEMTLTECGTPEEDNPCAVAPEEYDGWDYEITVVASFNIEARSRDSFISAPGTFTYVLNSADSVVGNSWTNTTRARMHDGQSGVGNWFASTGGDFINPGGPLAENKATITFGFRHWTEASPTIWHTRSNVVGNGNIVDVPPFFNTITWADKRP